MQGENSIDNDIQTLRQFGTFSFQSFQEGNQSGHKITLECKANRFQSTFLLNQNIEFSLIAMALERHQYKLVSLDKNYVCLVVLCVRLNFTNVQILEQEKIKAQVAQLEQKLEQETKKTENLTKIIQQLQGQMEIISLKLETNQKTTAQLSSNIDQSSQTINQLHNQLKSSNSQQQWHYFDSPKFVAAFNYDTKEQVSYRFDHIISKDTQAKEIKLIMFLRTGNEQNVTFWTKTRLLNGKKQSVHWTYGHRYPQNAISYNSETVIFPVHETREIRVMSDHLQLSNCHQMQYFISGYKSTEKNWMKLIIE